MLQQRPQRIIVIGPSGVGKTTLARQLADLLGVRHVELDALHWGPNWTMAPLETFRDAVCQALYAERWVADGNYSKVRDIVWPAADTLVWLDYPLPVVFWRLLIRTLTRSLHHERLWNDNQETLFMQFFTRDSLFLWLLRSYGRHRRQYPHLLRQPEYAHLDVVRLRSPAQTRRWLQEFGQ